MWRPQDQKELTAEWVLIHDSPQTFGFSLSPSITQWERHSYAHNNSEGLGQQFCQCGDGRLLLCLSCKPVRTSETRPPLLSRLTPRMDSISLQEQPLEQSPMDLPSVKGALPRDDMCAVPAHEELDSVVEGLQALLGHRGLCLLDDVQRVRRA